MNKRELKSLIKDLIEEAATEQEVNGVQPLARWSAKSVFAIESDTPDQDFLIKVFGNSEEAKEKLPKYGSFRKISRWFKEAKVVGKLNKQQKDNIIEEFALSDQFFKLVERFNESLYKSMLKSKPLQTKMKAFIRANNREAIQDVLSRYSGIEKDAMRRFYDKHSDEMSYYDILHTYVDLEPIESPDEYISVGQRASVTTQYYVGTIEGGKFTDDYTKENPFTTTSVQGI